MKELTDYIKTILVLIQYVFKRWPNPFYMYVILSQRACDETLIIFAKCWIQLAHQVSRRLIRLGSLMSI